MATYANSDETRTGLIMAAGELFAEYGLDGVSVRDIANKAEANIGVIHYHFGGKDGLIEAVMDFAVELWKSDPLGGFLAERRYLLKTANGQNMVITGMVELFLEKLFSPEKPAWCCTLAFQIIQRDREISRRVFECADAPALRALVEVYRAVSGDADIERAYNWSSAIVAPAVLYAVDPYAIRRIHPDGAPSAQFPAKLKASAIQHALSSIQFLRIGKENKDKITE